MHPRPPRRRHGPSLAIVLALVLHAMTGPARAEAPSWRATWIGPETSTPNQWLCFRKTVDLAEAPADARARIAVDSKYWLWINGKLVIFEGGLKRGPTPDGTYFDEVDLAPHLAKGPNTIAVLVWYFGRHGFAHNSSGKAGLLFDADLGGARVVSDKSWKMKAHPAFSTAPGEVPNFRLAEPNLRFDARQDLPGWIDAKFDDASWAVAVEAGAAPCAPWGSIEARPIPFWKDYGLKDYANTAELPQVGDGKVIKARLPYNAQVTPFLEVEGAAGQVIDIRTDNYKGGGSPNIRAEYVTRDGAQRFECFGWMNGHEVHYTIPAGVKIKALKFRETGYNAEFAGSFHCDDPMLNELWKKAARTLYVTMRDNYMDCPDRERAQWWGDAVNELGEVFYVFDPPAYSLTRKAILELARWQRADGTLYSPVPAGIPGPKAGQDGSWSKELPPQMLASVSKYGFWTYYVYTGDADTIRRVYPQVKKYLDIWQLDADGLVIHRKGDWDWHDWGKDIDARVLDSAWYHVALQGATGMARVAGAEGDVATWEARMKSIEGAFNRVFWTGTAYRAPDYRGDTDDRANAMAVVAGLAKPEQFPALREVFAKHRNAGPYMEKYVLEALCLMNQPADAIERAKQRYADQLASELTTLWEGWGIGAKGYGGGTYNHAWSGGPLTMMSQYIAGVEPLDHGYAKFAVQPQMGPLKKIDAVVPTPKGNIKLDLKRDTANFRLALFVPVETTARVCIPKDGRAIREVRVNGTVAWKGGQAAGSIVKFIDDAAHGIAFETGPGHWLFEAAP